MIHEKSSYQLGRRIYDHKISFKWKAYNTVCRRQAQRQRNWEEPQIAGEIFGSAHHNGTLYRGKAIAYPFYKTAVGEEYLDECQNEGLPTRNRMVIKRYPKDANPYNAWDFCDENDRLKILKMLKSIESKSINMVI